MSGQAVICPAWANRVIGSDNSIFEGRQRILAELDILLRVGPRNW